MIKDFLSMTMGLNSHNETRLTVEESGNEIAYLQGQVSGYNILKNVIEEKTGEIAIGEKQCIFRYNRDEDFWFIEKDISKENIQSMYYQSQVLKDELENYGVNKEIKAYINEKKDWLFYEAEKGRDLHFCRGFNLILEMFNAWIRAIERKWESKESELF